MRLAVLLLGVSALAQAPITRDVIQKRLGELRQQYEQAIANANALHGAILDCEYWLQQLEPKKAEKK